MTEPLSPPPYSRFRCPQCGRDSSLWRGVLIEGWESVDSSLQPHFRSPGLDRGVDWDVASPDGTYGCAECGWEGSKQDLVELGNNGEPLTKVHPQQESMC